MGKERVTRKDELEGVGGESEGSNWRVSVIWQL